MFVILKKISPPFWTQQRREKHAAEKKKKKMLQLCVRLPLMLAQLYYVDKIVVGPLIHVVHGCGPTSRRGVQEWPGLNHFRGVNEHRLMYARLPRGYIVRVPPRPACRP